MSEFEVQKKSVKKIKSRENLGCLQQQFQYKQIENNENTNLSIFNTGMNVSSNKELVECIESKENGNLKGNLI